MQTSTFIPIHLPHKAEGKLLTMDISLKIHQAMYCNNSRQWPKQAKLTSFQVQSNLFYIHLLLHFLLRTPLEFLLATLKNFELLKFLADL